MVIRRSPNTGNVIAAITNRYALITVNRLSQLINGLYVHVIVQIKAQLAISQDVVDSLGMHITNTTH